MREGALLTMGGGGGRDYLLTVINICAVKNVTTARGLPQKLLWGASLKMPPPPHAEKETPPQGENLYTFCTNRKNAPIGEKKPPPPIQFFFHAILRERLLFLPLACANHDLHSLYSVCLRELEKINKQ